MRLVNEAQGAVTHSVVIHDQQKTHMGFCAVFNEFVHILPYQQLLNSLLHKHCCFYVISGYCTL